jgi:hypothetical protein
VDVQVDVDPERAAELITKVKALPGVTRAGWTSGGIDLSRAIRIPAGSFRDSAGKLDRTKLGDAIAAVAAKALSAQPGGVECLSISCHKPGAAIGARDAMAADALAPRPV